MTPYGFERVVEAHNGDLDAVRDDIRHSEYRDLVARYKVSTGTVSEWKRLYPKVRSRKGKSGSVSAIELHHAGDKEAVKREIAATEITALAERYGVDIGAVRKWEGVYETRALRICRGHKGLVRFDQLRRNDRGSLTLTCVDCPAPGEVVRRTQQGWPDLCPVLRDFSRQPLSTAQGGLSYWQQRGEWMLSTEYEMEGV